MMEIRYDDIRDLSGPVEADYCPDFSINCPYCNGTGTKFFLTKFGEDVKTVIEHLIKTGEFHQMLKDYEK